MKKDIMKSKFKVNDNVIVISGNDRGRRGKLLFIDRKLGRVIVEGVNKKQKYVKPSQENPKGGILKREYPINISNVMLFCEKCKKGFRSSIEITDNNKNRICKKCGKSIDK